jgi:amidase
MSTSPVHTFADELARLDAVGTAQAVTSGELHPREVVEAAVARAEAVASSLGAMVTTDFDRALDGPFDVGERPFGGVPTFIKDSTDVAGLPTRQGSDALRRARPATRTEMVAQQMFDMGMVGLGKSTLPEFGFTPSTEFPDAPPTRNPWNPTRTPGGSSGGSAALVAAGVVPIAHGADGGGSIRVPAACCGLVGLKASRGRLVPSAETKHLPVAIVVDGVLSRSVRDTARYYAEAERRYRNSRLPPVGEVDEPLSRRLDVGVVWEHPTGTPLDEPTRRALDDTVGLLESLGHRVRSIPAPIGPEFPEDFKHYWSMLAFAVRAAGGRLYDPSFTRAELSGLTDGLAARFRHNVLRTPGAIRRLRRTAAEAAELFAGLDVMLSPTVTTVPPLLGHLGMDLPFDVLFPRMEDWIGFTPIANASGAPSISLPLGHDDDTGTPVGVMFGAGLGEEALLLALALELEQAAPWTTLAG